MKKFLFSTITACALFAANPALAVELSMVSGSTGNDIEVLKGILSEFEKETGNTVKLVPMPSSTTDQFGQYRLWLAAGNQDIDIYQTDVIWAPQLADHLVDLTQAATANIKDHFPSVIESQTVGGKLVALPIFTDAPALYYRKDLLEKYSKTPPKTWDELAATAKEVQDKERAAGNKDIFGFVFQGNSYEGLTCNALEWVKSNGGGQIVEADGSISINNPKAAEAIDRAASWIGSISPKGVLAYQEEEARGVWQMGNAVFMRNWPYAFAAGNGADSKVKDKFDIVPLPAGSGEGAVSSATLGGWNVAVSKYSRHTEEATKLAVFLSGKYSQKTLAIKGSHLPTISALYDDADIAREQPVLVRWKAIFTTAVPRPSAPTKIKYNEVSSLFWNAVHDTLAGSGKAADNLEELEVKLQDLKGSGW